MDQKGLLMEFWKHEAIATRKVISRIPEDQSNYRPHPRSRTAREIAWLMVLEEKLLIDGLENGLMVWREEDPPARVKDVLEKYDAQHDEIVNRLERLDQAKWETQIAFEVDGTSIVECPVLNMAGSFSSIRYITEANSRLTFVRWVPKCLRLSDRVPMK